MWRMGWPETVGRVTSGGLAGTVGLRRKSISSADWRFRLSDEGERQVGLPSLSRAQATAASQQATWERLRAGLAASFLGVTISWSLCLKWVNSEAFVCISMYPLNTHMQCDPEI